MQDCCVAYCIAIAHLIRNPGQAQEALEAAKIWVRESGGEEVEKWMAEAQLDGVEPPCNDQTQGWVRWGFTSAFRWGLAKSPVRIGKRVSFRVQVQGSGFWDRRV